MAQRELTLNEAIGLLDENIEIYQMKSLDEAAKFGLFQKFHAFSNKYPESKEAGNFVQEADDILVTLGQKPTQKSASIVALKILRLIVRIDGYLCQIGSLILTPFAFFIVGIPFLLLERLEQYLVESIDLNISAVEVDKAIKSLCAVKSKASPKEIEKIDASIEKLKEIRKKLK